MSIKHPMKPADIEYTSGPLENQIPPYMGQGNLFVALEVN